MTQSGRSWPKECSWHTASETLLVAGSSACDCPVATAGTLVQCNIYW